eukprot:SAG22_NODE_2305_length_2736_cov_1.701934_1_plen_286_part_00
MYPSYPPTFARAIRAVPAAAGARPLQLPVTGQGWAARGHRTWAASSPAPARAEATSAAMKPSQALAELGAAPDLLTAAELHSLDSLGFVVLHDVLSAEELLAFRARLDALAASEGGAGPNGEEEAGTQRVSNLVDKDPLFERFITAPRVLAAIAHVAGADIQLSSLSSRTVLPREDGGGEASQAFHRDWLDNGDPNGRFAVCNSMWMIDAFTESSGSTRVVPGSHLSNGSVGEHPTEVTVCGPAGSVAVFNSHIYHAGGRNTTDRHRRGVLAYFARRSAMHGPSW